MLWHFYLATSGQTTIEFYYNRYMASQAKAKGEVYHNAYDLGTKKNFDLFFGKGEYVIFGKKEITNLTSQLLVFLDAP